MHIRRLELQNFRNYRHQVIDFGDARRALIVGENGAGKSTIIDAIALALTGRCRGVNEKGEGLKSLIKTGEEEARVILTIDGHEPIVRTLSAKHGATSNFPTDMVMGALKVTKPMVSAAIYGGTFFELHHADAKNLLMRLLNVRVTIPSIGDAPSEIVSLDEVERRYDVAFEDRKELKQQLAKMVVPDVVDKRGDLETLDESQLAKSLEAAKDYFEATTQRTAEIRARGQQLLEKRKELAQRIDEDPATLRIKAETHAGMAQEHAARVAEAQTQVEAIVSARETDSQHEVSAVKVQELRLFINRIETTTVPLLKRKGKHKESIAGGAIPVCVLGEGIPCLTPASEFKSAIARARTELAEIEARLKAGTESAERLASARQQVKTEEQHEMYHRTQAEALVKRADEEQARRQALEQARSQALEIDAEVSKANQEQAESRDAMDRLWRQQEELGRYRAEIRRLVEAEAAKKQVSERVALAEESVKILGPTGVRTAALQKALGDFTGDINEALSVFGFRVFLVADPWQIAVKHASWDRPVAYDLLSKGQRLWTGLCFQLALAMVSGLQFVIIDDVEGVVGSSLKALTGLVMRSPVDQVLVVKAQAKDQPLPSFSGLTVMSVSDGEVSSTRE